MLIHVPHVLDAAGVANLRGVIDDGEWVDGNVTSGPQAALAKNNEQLAEGTPAAREGGAIVLDALGRSPLFIAAALPLKTFPPLFNRYAGGQAFDPHAPMQPIVEALDGDCRLRNAPLRRGDEIRANADAPGERRPLLRSRHQHDRVADAHLGGAAGLDLAGGPEHRP